MAGKKIFLTALIAAFLTITLGGVFLSLMLQQRGLREEVEVLRKELRDEANSRTAILKKMDLNQQLLFRNLNESREVLKLPGTKAISVYPEPEKAPEAGGGGGDGKELREEQFFRGVRHFSEYYRNRRLDYGMVDFLKSRGMGEILKGDDLSLLKSEELVYLLKRGGDLGTVFFVIRGQYDDGVPVLWVTSMLKQEAKFSLEGV